MCGTSLSLGFDFPVVGRVVRVWMSHSTFLYFSPEAGLQLLIYVAAGLQQVRFGLLDNVALRKQKCEWTSPCSVAVMIQRVWLMQNQAIHVSLWVVAYRSTKMPAHRNVHRRITRTPPPHPPVCSPQHVHMSRHGWPTSTCELGSQTDGRQPPRSMPLLLLLAAAVSAAAPAAKVPAMGSPCRPPPASCRCGEASAPSASGTSGAALMGRKSNAQTMELLPVGGRDWVQAHCAAPMSQDAVFCLL